jgi:hypothetical protein
MSVLTAYRLVRRWLVFVRFPLFALAQSLVVQSFVVQSFCAQILFAQNAPSEMEFIHARLQNVLILPPRTVEFEIALERLRVPSRAESEILRRWANGTFILRAEGLPLEGAILALDTTDIQTLEQFTPLAFPPERKGYEFRLVVAPERGFVAIAVLGPDSASVAQTIAEGAPFLIGRFRLRCRDIIPNSALVRLEWSLETARYQANAFKAETAMTAFGAAFERNDNVEAPTRYLAESPSVEDAPELVAQGFSAEYIGDKRARLRWNTLRERVGRRTNAGFILLRRKERAHTLETPPQTADARAFDTVATFARGAGGNALRLRGVSTGAEYEYIDSALERGYRYFYRLSALDATPRAAQEFSARIEADDGEIVVPNAILGAAEIFPNPFAESPIVRYTLLDRADVAIHLYDALGRLVRSKEIAQGQARGEYEYRLSELVLPNHAVIFATLSALPQGDAAVEGSRVTFKLQKER